MNLNLNTILRKIVPRKLQTLIRFYQIFNNIYGHSNLVNGFIQRGDGNFLPWLTYPLIEYLNTLDLKDCHVFEYGSGSSTHYWAQRVESVTSVEKDKVWFEKVKTSLPINCNISLKIRDQDYIDEISCHQKKFDIIIIDGAVRYPCTEKAIDHLSERGIIILDNSDWYPQTCKLLQENGFIQIDFAGFSPLNAFTSVSSLFYKKNKLLKRKAFKIEPMGGRDIGIAYDDKTLYKIDKKFLIY